MGYKVLRDRDSKWQPRKGLEGPFFYPNGWVLYYDPKEGQYYDAGSDIYLSNEEADMIVNSYFDKLRG